MGWVDATPLWLVGLVCVVGLLAAYELGFRAGEVLVRRRGHNEGTNFLISSVLSLVGLMMAFTFGQAQSEYRQRQELLVAEANALGAVYFRIQMLPQPWRGSLGQQLASYADVRAQFHDASGDADKLSRNSADTAAQQQELWRLASKAIEDGVMPTLSEPVAQSIDEAFRVAASRRAAEDIRIPVAVLFTLIVLAFVTTAIVGFAGAAKGRYTYITVTVLVVQIMAFCLILALDRPGSIAVRINKSPMDRTIAAIRQSEAAKSASGPSSDQGSRQ